MVSNFLYQLKARVYYHQHALPFFRYNAASARRLHRNSWMRLWLSCASVIGESVFWMRPVLASLVQNMTCFCKPPQMAWSRFGGNEKIGVCMNRYRATIGIKIELIGSVS